jgi:hypothetical protein
MKTSSKFRGASVVFLLLAAIAIYLAGLPQNRRPAPKTAAPDASPGPEFAPAQPGLVHAQHEARQNPWLWPNKVADAPTWAVSYGKEFWRRQATTRDTAAKSVALPEHVDLGDIMERVSHAADTETNSTSPRVLAQTYLARWEERGLRFSPHRLTEGFVLEDAGAEAGFRTVAVRKGSEFLFRDGENVPARSVIGNTVQGALNREAGVIEHYEARREGVEVTWVLQKIPAGRGALEIEAELSGLNHAGQSEHGHHFADASGTSRVRVGHATLVDNRGTRTSLPVTVDGSSLRVTVPEDLLAAAVFPIAIDPVISAEFGMNTPVLSYALNDTMDPAIASNGSEYLAVWVDNRSANGYLLYGTRVSQLGAVLDPRGLPLNVNVSGVLYPTVASNGRDFLVVWQNGFSGARRITGMRVTAAGMPLDRAPFLEIGYGNGHPRPAAASDGTNYLVVWEHERSADLEEDIVGARVTSGGVVLDTSSLIIRGAPNRQRGPAIAWNGSNYFVVWDDGEGWWNSQTLGVRVTSAGGVIEPSPIVIGGNAPGTFPTPAVASDGQDFLVALDGHAVRVSADGTPLGSVLLGADGIPAVSFNGENYLIVLLSETVRGVRVSPSGAVLGTTVIKPSPVSWHDWSRPSVASANGDYFAVWHERTVSGQHVFGAHVTGSGATPGAVPVSTDLSSQYAPVVASNGEDYLVVWNEIRFETHDDIFGARVSGSGEVLDPAGLAIRRAPLREWSPAVASDGRDYFVTWQEYPGGNAWYIHGARVTREGAVWPAIQINNQPTDQRSPAIASNGRDYLVAWTEWGGGDANHYDIHAARVSGAGSVLDPAGFVISTRPSHEWSPSIASDGRDYLVAWHGLYYPATHVSAKRVTSEGVVLDPGGITLTTSTNEPNDPSVAFNGRHYFVAWKEYQQGPAGADIFGTRIGTDGTVLDNPPLPIAAGLNHEIYPKVASDGRDFLVLWHAWRGGLYSADLFARRITTDGQLLDGSGFLVQSSGYSIHGTAASNGRNYLAVYSPNDGDGLYRVRARFITFPVCPPPIQWQVGFGGSDFDGLASIEPTADGGYILAGGSYSEADGNKTTPNWNAPHTADAWIMRLNASGQRIWEASFGGFQTDLASSVRQTRDGGFIVAGWSSSSDNGNKSSPNIGGEDGWVIRLDAQGDKLWDRSFGGGGFDLFFQVHELPGGGFVLGGISGSDYWVVRIDAQGNKLWEKFYGGTAAEQLFDLRPTSDGGFILGGGSASTPSGNKTSPNFGSYDYWVVRVDANGNKLWDKSFGGSQDEEARSVWQTSDGGFMLAGRSYSGTNGNKTAPNKGNSDYWLVRLDANGSKLWDKSFGGSGNDEWPTLHPMPDGGWILGGNSASPADGDKTSPFYGGEFWIGDYWIVRLDARGNQIWDQSFGGDGSEDLRSMRPTPDGGLILAGSSTSGATGNKTTGSFGRDDWWIVKLAPPSEDDCDRDRDDDGVPDDRDQCLNTAVGAVVNAQGCSIAQLCPCDGPWRNHGEYVDCVMEHAWEFYRLGLINENERKAITRAAVRSDCGKSNPLGEPVSIHLCPQTREECERDGMRVVLSGDAPGGHVIESSTDLLHWTAVETGDTTVIGDEILFPIAPHVPARFYRVVVSSEPGL